jgi:hypothetical protein
VKSTEDTAVQRTFPIYERTALLFRAETFNLLNHPNFGTVNAICRATAAGAVCNNALMGEATNTISVGLGGVSRSINKAAQDHFSSFCV